VPELEISRPLPATEIYQTQSQYLFYFKAEKSKCRRKKAGSLTSKMPKLKKLTNIFKKAALQNRGQS
jgi:hypothetical protein